MKRLILLIILTLNISGISFAQIIIRDENIVEKALMKPQQFDSLTNFSSQEKIIDYKKFIGYKLFYKPSSKKYKKSSTKIIDFLYSNDSTLIIKEGKIPFDKVYIYAGYRNYGDSKKLKGKQLELYNEKKKKYDETIEKEWTKIYKPHFYYRGTSNDDGEIYGKMGTEPADVEGKYFTIIDIKAKEEPYYSKGKYVNLEDLEDYTSWQVSLKIVLRDEETQEELYWIVNQARNLDNSFFDNPFYLVPYFEKKRQLYLNKKFLLRKKDYIPKELKDLVDVNTGAIVNLNHDELWECTDISFIETESSPYLECFYFLKNGDREIKINADSNILKYEFITESEFIEQNKKEEEKRKAEEEKEKIRLQEIEKFKSETIAKWGKKIGNYIIDGKVVLGMSKEMCIASWGEPININRTIVKGLTTEQWVYGYGTYLYFNNGVLTAIQD